MKIFRLFIAFTLICFALLPTTQAVVPAPDGGYTGQNTAEGQSALFSLTTGGYNTAVGWLSLRNDTGGSFNTGVGAGTLPANTADENTATGAGALLSNNSGAFNTANGAFALFSNTTGTFNTANGVQALFDNNTGGHNTAIGENALFNNNIGSFNTATGYGALSSNTTGNTNIALGFGAGLNVITANNVICIGANGNNVDNACYIGQIFGATSFNGVAVFVNSSGRLGTMTSSNRFKEHIKPMDNASESLYSLKPVSFRYKKQVDPEGTSAMQFGLVAEEVEKVNPDLVVRDKEGKPYSVRYDQVNAMLFNEFLKEHKKVEKQEATIKRLANDFQTVSAQQRNEMQLLSAQLKEQAAQIQKVSAQPEVSKAAPQTVLNRQ
jgi:endosialidase-like protein